MKKFEKLLMEILEPLEKNMGVMRDTLENMRVRSDNDRLDFDRRLENIRSAYITPPGYARMDMFAEDRPVHPGRSLLD